MDKKCMYCMHISQFFDSCELPWECKYESNFIAKRFIEELEKLKTELHETAEMHSNGNYYLRDEWIDEYINKHITELKGEAE